MKNETTAYILKNNGELFSLPLEDYPEINYHKQLILNKDADYITNSVYFIRSIGLAYWFYDHSSNDVLKNIIKNICYKIVLQKEDIEANSPITIDIIADTPETILDKNLSELYRMLIENVSLEFAWIRFYDLRVPNRVDNAELCIRLANDNINWVDIIINCLNTWPNKFNYITIGNDFIWDIRESDYYYIDNVEIKRMPIQDFLTANKNSFRFGKQN